MRFLFTNGDFCSLMYYYIERMDGFMEENQTNVNQTQENGTRIKWKQKRKSNRRRFYRII